MKPIPFEVLARILGPKVDIKPTVEPAAPEPDEPLAVLEGLVKLQAPNRVAEEPRQMLLPLEAVASLSERRTASHIVDITDQFIGKSLIITGASKPEDSH
jgi:hypothetical protein